ncbi:hypothetical protein ACIG47_05910 [Promicromonospora sp. NPDC052451]|uniref:hypothetical protein n=1 Tax=Promicromonospora sp. NPDC052451 TaxID=3364407 RepID=UPI0037CB2494
MAQVVQALLELLDVAAHGADAEHPVRLDGAVQQQHGLVVDGVDRLPEAHGRARTGDPGHHAGVLLRDEPDRLAVGDQPADLLGLGEGAAGDLGRGGRQAVGVRGRWRAATEAVGRRERRPGGRDDARPDQQAPSDGGPGCPGAGCHGHSPLRMSPQASAACW